MTRSSFSFGVPSTSYPFPFLFTDTVTPGIYTLSLHDALPIYEGHDMGNMSMEGMAQPQPAAASSAAAGWGCAMPRSEEHTSELQSIRHLVCRLLLEKKNCERDQRGKLLEVKLHQLKLQKPNSK